MKNLNELTDCNTNPRAISLLILSEYFKRKYSLKKIIEKYFKEYKLSSLDRRFIYNIVKGTLRNLLRIDFCIYLFSNKKIENIDFPVLNILRMGIYQLIFMDRIPSYSVVDESVNITKKSISLSSSKFVNAILRRLSSINSVNKYIEKKLKNIIKDEIKRISIWYSFPEWLIKYWIENYGSNKAILICKSLNENPYFYLRFNKNKITREELIKKLDLKSNDTSVDNLNIEIMQTSALDNVKEESDNHTKGYILSDGVLEETIEVSGIQGIFESDVYKKGLISIQDLSSQIAVKYFLKPEKGEKVLDVCSAPGGKTTYIAQLMENKGEIISVDISKSRLRMLEENLERLDIKNVRIVIEDAAKPDFLDRHKEILSNESLEHPGEVFAGNNNGSKSTVGLFDKILVDAPCSAFGTISKNPDVKYNKRKEDLIRLSDISCRILSNCNKYLKAGGKVVFYTCTISPIENKMVIEKFIERFKGKYELEILNLYEDLKPILKYKEEAERLKKISFFEIMPFYFKSEGGFICSLIKKS